MTEIAFHFNVPDRLAYGCRLLRKAYLGGSSVMVTADAMVLAELDRWLWHFSATEFVPHNLFTTPENYLAASPILLAESLADCPHQEVLVNFGPGIPANFERFERFIEVVTRAQDDMVAARSRWKHYASRGYSLKKHDLAVLGAGA